MKRDSRGSRRVRPVLVPALLLALSLISGLARAGDPDLPLAICQCGGMPLVNAKVMIEVYRPGDDAVVSSQELTTGIGGLVTFSWDQGELETNDEIRIVICKPQNNQNEGDPDDYDCDGDPDDPELRLICSDPDDDVLSEIWSLAGDFQYRPVCPDRFSSSGQRIELFAFGSD